MHKKFTAFCLPVLGSLVIVGAGFSAWVFNSELSASTDLTGTIGITEVQSGFNVRMLDASEPTRIIASTYTDEDDASLNLVLDQGAADPTGINVGDGITWQYVIGSDHYDLTNVVLQFGFEDGSNLDALFVVNDLVVTYTLTLTMGDTTNYLDYVVMVKDADPTADSETTAKDGIIKNEAKFTAATNSGNGVVGTTSNIDLTLNYVAHKAESTLGAGDAHGKPTTSAEHKAMKEAVGDSASQEGASGSSSVKLSVTVSAEWEAK